MNLRLITLAISGILLASSFTVIANDQYIFDENFGNNPSIIKISDNIFAIAYTGPENTGLLKTIEINNDGEIVKKIINSIEFEPIICNDPSIIQICDNIYAIAYSGEFGSGFIKTIEVGKNGRISESIIFTYQYAERNVNQPNLIHFYEDYYGVAYGDQGTLKVLKIDNRGRIEELSEYISGISFSASDGLSPYMFHIRENIFGVVFTGDYDTGGLVTFAIEITDVDVSYQGINYIIFDNIKALTPIVTKVNSNIYSITYTTNNNNGKIITLEISSNGVIRRIIDSLSFDTTKAINPDIESLSSNYFAISYTGDNNDGFIKTIEIDSNGDISSECLDNIEFDESQALFSDLINICNDNYGIAYSGQNNIGTLKTIQIDSGGNILVDQKACDVDDDLNQEYAKNLDWDLTNGYEEYLDEDESSEYLVRIDGDSDRKFDYFINTDLLTKDPDVYWDPDNNILSNIRIQDIDYDGILEWVYDSDGDDEEDRYYDLSDRQIHNFQSYTLDIDIDGNGTVITQPNGVEFLVGTEVRLNAEADQGWSFDSWSGDILGENNELSIIIDADKSVTAHFTKDPVYYELIVEIVGEGSTDIISGTYEEGTPLTINAIPESCSSFSYWSGDISGSDNPMSFIMDDDKNIVANFEKDSYNLTINVYGNGITSPSEGIHSYDCGTSVDIEAIADIGSVFSHFSGDLTGSNNQSSILMDSKKTINAHFEDIEYSLILTTSGSGFGSIEASPAGPFFYGDVVTIWANASVNSDFISWSDDLSGSNSPNTLVMDSNKSIDAQFDLKGPFTLSVSTSGSGSGVVDVCPVGPYYFGDVVSVWANASSGSEFVSWSGDLSGSVSPENIVVDSDKSIDAQFDLLPVYHNLTISISGNGSISPSPGTYFYLEDSVVEVSAYEISGWSFSHWSGDIYSSENPISILMDSDKSITAHFTKDPVYYNLSINIGGNGTTNPSVGTYNYLEYSNITISANAESCWSFSNWSGDLFSSQDTITFVISSDMSITANFVKDIYSLTINTNGNGTTNPISGTHFYECGTTVNLEAITSIGWNFDFWSGDINSSNNQTLVTMDSDKTVNANFNQIEYTVDITTSGNGSGYVNIQPDGPYHYGNIISLNAVSQNGSSFIKWSGDLSENNNPESLTITKNLVIDAEFSRNPVYYDLTINSVGNGNTIPSVGTYSYLEGSVVDIEAIPSDGWNFDSWTGAINSTNNLTSITIDSDKIITANFIINNTNKVENFTLNVNIVGNGTVDIIPDLLEYPENTTVTLIANASAGWGFSHWSGDINGSNSQIIILMDSNKSITAHFTEIIVYYNLEILIFGNGSTTPEEGNHSYVEGTNVSLNAIPDFESIFVGWFLDLYCNESNANIIIDENKTIVAFFANITVNYTLNVSIVGNGSVEVIPDMPEYPENYVVTLIANASVGWNFSHWSGDYLNNSKIPLTIILMDSNKSITAHFVMSNNTNQSQNETEDDGDHEGSDNGNTNNGGGGGGPPPFTGGNQNTDNENKKPIADATATKQTFAYIGEDVLFNGSKSYDLDGNITEFIWFFDDGTNESGENVIHNFTEQGVYNVELVVIDDDLEFNNTILEIVILKANIPPEKADIKGPAEAEIYKNINFEIVSNDEDSINLSYIIFWDDESDVEEFTNISSGVPILVNHSWNQSGNYTITVKTVDSDGTISEESNFNITINDNKTDNTYKADMGNSFGFLPILLIIFLLILLTILFFIILDRKKQKEEKQEKEKQKQKNKENKSSKSKKQKNSKKKKTDKEKSKSKKSEDSKKQSKKNKKTNKKKSKPKSKKAKKTNKPKKKPTTS